MRRFLNVVRFRAARSSKEAELQEELAFHLSEEVEEKQADGLSSGEARQAALRELGNVARVMEESRAAWGTEFLDTFWQDVKYGARSLRKNAGVSALIVLILGLGIGASAAVFSIVNTVILKPLAYRDAERVMSLSTLWKKAGDHGPSSLPDFMDWRSQNKSFEAMACYAPRQISALAGTEAEFVNMAGVSPDFFRVFGAEPVAGRLLNEEEMKPGSNGAVVISYKYWHARFGGRAGAIGKNIRVGARTLAIVGVAPAGFHFPDQTDLWLPFLVRQPPSRGAHNYFVAGRLKPGVTVPQAQAEMAVIADRLERRYPATNSAKTIEVLPLLDALVGDVRLMLYVLLGAVGLVLLVACGNVANLLLAKASTRTREIAMRAALGAGRARIVRQLLTESLLLSLVAGALGLALAWAGLATLVSLAPGNIPRLADTRVDLGVLGFALGASVLACFVFGLAPAFRSARPDLCEPLKQASGRGSIGTHANLRQALVVAEVALSVVLLAGAGLLIRSFSTLVDTALGFRPDNVLVMETSIPSLQTEAGGRQATAVVKRLLAEAAAIPRISVVGGVRVPPGEVLSDGGYWLDRERTAGELRVDLPQAAFNVVTPGAFEALGIPLTRGRDFTAQDTFDAPRSVIVNETLAKRALPGGDPLGHKLGNGFDITELMTIVGVVGDIRQNGPAREPRPEIYMPYEQHPGPSTTLSIVARTSVRPEGVMDALRRRVREITPETSVKFTTMDARMSENVAAPRFRTLVLGIFAAFAVVLAMAGVYGMLSFTVSQRTGEIGLRMALGADAGDVARIVVGQGARLAAAGLVIGLAGALAATRLLESLLFEVKPFDPLTYAGVTAMVALVTLGACCFPARRAARVDPLVALRQE